MSSITTPRCGWIEFKFGACIYHYLNLCLLTFGDLPCIVVKKINLKYHSCVYMAYKNMGKLLIKKKTEEQVCHDFDQFLPLYAAVKD